MSGKAGGKKFQEDHGESLTGGEGLFVRTDLWSNQRTIDWTRARSLLGK